ncbi:MAG: hypothetical protein N2Z79_04165, partial [Candidatus Omnitrophica bacterium]|nr:hypothetical protein [Candidatus Omnitrophota bacterium]
LNTDILHIHPYSHPNFAYPSNSDLFFAYLKNTVDFLGLREGVLAYGINSNKYFSQMEIFMMVEKDIPAERAFSEKEILKIFIPWHVLRQEMYLNQESPNSYLIKLDSFLSSSPLLGGDNFADSIYNKFLLSKSKLEKIFSDTPDEAKSLLSQVIQSNPQGILLLNKLIRPEVERGIRQDNLELRRFIWELIIAYSFRGQEIKQIEKEQLPYNCNLSYLKGLGHILIKGILPKSARLELGRPWAKFEGYGGSGYLLEMDNGFPIRIFFFKDNSSWEFLKIIDNQTKEIIDVHLGKIRRDKFIQFKNVAIFDYLNSEGHLGLGGGRPLVDGSRPKRLRPWAKFAKHAYEKVEITVK